MAVRDPAMGHIFLSRQGLEAERLNALLASVGTLAHNVEQLWTVVRLLAREVETLQQDREASCVSGSSDSES